MALVLRVVSGKHAGEYFAGVTTGECVPMYTDHANALRCRPHDAAGHTTSFMDRMCTAVIAECLPETAEDEPQQYAEVMVRGMFQRPAADMIDLVRRTVRKSSDDQFAPVQRAADADLGYMSVWEWMHLVIQAGGLQRAGT